MPKLSQEKIEHAKAVFEKYSNIYHQPDIIRDFMMRMAEEQNQVVYSQNQSWKGFLQAPFSDDVGNADIVMYGIGHDTSSQEMGDTRHAPMYLRNCSHYIPPVHSEWVMAPFEMCNVIDRGDIDKFAMDYTQGVDWDVEHALEYCRDGALPLRIGGTHCILGGTMVAANYLADKYFPGEPMGGIMFDGHADMGTPFDAPVGGDWVNGSQVGRAIVKGWVDPEKMFFFGMRGFGIDPLFGSVIARELGLVQVGPIELEEKGCGYYVDMMRERIGKSPCFITTDLDSLCPSQGGGTTQRDGFGLMWREVRQLARALKGLNLVAADICEYAPTHDTYGRSTGFMVAALMFEYLCMLVDSKVRINGGRYNQTHWDLNLSSSAGYNGQERLEEWRRLKNQD